WSSLPVQIGAAAGLATLGLCAMTGDRRDAAFSASVGRAATHPVWGLPILAVVLLLAYKVVGVFGAGTAVDFVENRVFGSTVAEARLAAPQAPAALTASDVADDGAERLVVLRAAPGEPANAFGTRVVAQKKVGGVYVDDRGARVDVYGAEARVWSGYLN